MAIKYIYVCVCVIYVYIYIYTVAYDYSLFFRLFILHEMISALSTDPLWQGYRLGKKLRYCEKSLVSGFPEIMFYY